MSIISEYSEYLLVCDICGNSESYETFYDAVEAKKDNNWKSEKTGQSKEWIDICPDCRER